MFDPIEHRRRTKRIQQKDRHIKRQCNILKQNTPDHWQLNEPHRFAKKHSLNCGNPNCIFCMNPRKGFKEKTIQERRFYDSKNQDDIE